MPYHRSTEEIAGADWTGRDQNDRLVVASRGCGHGCDQFFHPKGMASDLGGATDRATGMSTNFTPGTTLDNEAFDRSFVEYFSTILPDNAGLGQAECAGRTTAKVRAAVHYLDDTCTHQHVQMSY